MVGRSRKRYRVVLLATAVATLLAAWLPPGRACACPTAPAAAETASNAEPAAVCPCCGTRPSTDEAPRPCCVSHGKAASPGDTKGCECGSPARPGSPEPTAPPRPADSDDSHALTATGIAVAAPLAPVPAGPTAAETVVCRADPPPTDLVISLSRITC
jgi:hypothetical protein